MTSPHVRHRRRNRFMVAFAALVVAGAASFGVHYGLNTPEAAAATEVVVSSAAELESAFANATAGTTISVRAGTYSPSKSLRSDASGTASAPITVRPYGDGQVKVDGSKLASGSWLVAIYGSYWNVSDMTFQNSPAHGFVVTSSTGGVFTNLVTAYNGDSGFTLRGDNTVDNLVKNLDSYRNYDASANGENADGIAIKFGSGSGNVISGARLYENADDGLDMWAWETPVRIEYSWAFGNGKNRWDDSNWQGDGNGFKLGGNDEPTAHVVTNNAAWSNTANGFTENGNLAAMTIHKNTAYNNDGTGFFFETGAARLARNLAVDNGHKDVGLNSRTVSAANSWDSGVTVPSFQSTDGAEAYAARGTGGAQPAVTFLTTGSTAIGASMGG